MSTARSSRAGHLSIHADVKGSLTMLGMVVGSTIGGILPTLDGGGMMVSLLGSLAGGILGIWAGLRINERML